MKTIVMDVMRTRHPNIIKNSMVRIPFIIAAMAIECFHKEVFSFVGAIST